MKIEFVQGKSSCERCGAYIKNIYVITFNDGYVFRVGTECVKKVFQETNLSKKGCAYVEHLMKPVEKLQKTIAMWQNMTYETALKKNLLMMKWDDLKQAHREQTEKEYEETKKRMLKWLPTQLKEAEVKMNKILIEKGKNIQFRR